MRYVLLDRIVALEPGNRLRAIKNVTIGDDLVRHHGDGLRTLPSSMLVEAMAQAGGLLAYVTVDFAALPVLAKVSRAECDAWARPGDRVELDARLDDLRAEGCEIDAVACIDGRAVARATFVLALVGLDGETESRRAELHRNYLATLFPEWFGRRVAEEAVP
jgi:3-hydroxyacyl-[acyl-carrier-protein] dehydratase